MYIAEKCQNFLNVHDSSCDCELEEENISSSNWENEDEINIDDEIANEQEIQKEVADMNLINF